MAMAGFVIALFNTIRWFNAERYGRGELLIWAIYGFLMGVCGIFMYRRNRWVWLFGTLFSLNPLLWIVNGIYLRNRWAEMRGAGSPSRLTKPVKSVLPDIFYLYQSGTQFGPFHKEQVMTMWAEGRITADALYCEEAGTEWKKLLPYVTK